jgi:hypothetical protein
MTTSRLRSWARHCDIEVGIWAILLDHSGVWCSALQGEGWVSGFSQK